MPADQNQVQHIIAELQQWMENMHVQMIALTHKVQDQNQQLKTLQQDVLDHTQHNCAILVTQQEHHNAVFELQSRFEDMQTMLNSSTLAQLHAQTPTMPEDTRPGEAYQELPDATIDDYMTADQIGTAEEPTNQTNETPQRLNPVQAAFRAFRRRKHTLLYPNSGTQATTALNPPRPRGRPRKDTQPPQQPQQPQQPPHIDPTHTEETSQSAPPNDASQHEIRSDYAFIDDDGDDEEASSEGVPSSEQDEETSAALRSLKAQTNH
eukprot:4392358-Amphidinium_carterae.1